MKFSIAFAAAAEAFAMSVRAVELPVFLTNCGAESAVVSRWTFMSCSIGRTDPAAGPDFAESDCPAAGIQPRQTAASNAKKDFLRAKTFIDIYSLAVRGREALS